MSNESPDTYSVIGYPSIALAQAHPALMTTTAKLYGMTPAPTDRCRVLELGCGDGWHLIACAFALPGATFIGMDRAKPAVERGQQIAAELGLQNITFECADLMTYPTEGEPFDYILLHGVYSWVPQDVRDRCLELCKARLAPQGVAYVSYNCYPGCYVRRMVWEMLQFHVRDIQEPLEKIQQARAFTKVLADAATSNKEIGDFITSEYTELLEQKHPGALYHDDLNEINTPLYFHQFAAHAQQHGLQFLGESNDIELPRVQFPTGIRNMLLQLEKHDLLLKEQYLDFLTLRRFRHTLLCHQRVNLNREIKASQAKDFRMQSAWKPVSTHPSLAPGAREQFRNPQGKSLEVDHPLLKAALLCLAEIWPQSLPYETLFTLVHQRLQKDPASKDSLQSPEEGRAQDILSDAFLKLWQSGGVRWLAHQNEWSLKVPERPSLRRINRWELEKGNPTLTTPDLIALQISEKLDRQVLLLADGSRTQGEIIQAIGDFVQTAEVGLPVAQAKNDNDAPFADVKSAVEKSLNTGAQFGLFGE